jgi:NADH-quinone oxidoreductase subunit H
MNRPPFDLVEAEEEIAGGYMAEYSSIGFAFFYLAEFGYVITNSAIIVTLFLGGPDGPRIDGFSIGIVWFAIKVLCFLFIYVWFRATLPRFRYDQLMDLGWKRLIPVALGWLLIVAGFRTRDGWWGVLMIGLVLAGGGLLQRGLAVGRRATAVEAGSEKAG